MKTVLLSLVVGLQVAALLATTARHEIALRSGQLVLLETRPVDPRDLLRGDYVILAYDISQLPEKLFIPPLPAGATLPAGTKVHVELAPPIEGRFHRAVAASFDPLHPGPGHVVLSGTVQPNRFGGRTAAGPTVTVHYGLERYYVREGTGNPRGKLTVQVSVPPSGHAAIKQVFLDDVPYAEAMRASRP